MEEKMLNYWTAVNRVRAEEMWRKNKCTLFVIYIENDK